MRIREDQGLCAFFTRAGEDEVRLAFMDCVKKDGAWSERCLFTDVVLPEEALRKSG